MNEISDRNLGADVRLECFRSGKDGAAICAAGGDAQLVEGTGPARSDAESPNEII